MAQSDDTIVKCADGQNCPQQTNSELLCSRADQGELRCYRPLVLYHANCADGFCAAWIAHMKLPHAEFRPAQYGQEPPKDIHGRDVYILDFSYNRGLLLAMASKAETVTILDHHKSAEQDLAGLGTDFKYPNVRCYFNNTKSGGRMTWEYFFTDREPPWLIDYTEDRDFWRFALPNSRELNAAIRSYPHDFALWTQWAGMGDSFEYLSVDYMLGRRGAWREELFKKLITEGAAILRYQQQQVLDHCQYAIEIELDGYKVLAVNATTLSSEIAGKLAENRPFGVTWFRRGDGLVAWSLRSAPDGVDVSVVAGHHGGGGHVHAAGFESAAPPVPYSQSSEPTNESSNTV